jgi:hypothetical protein
MKIWQETIRLSLVAILIKKAEKSYTVTKLEEYDGPEIDWNRYEIRFTSKQMYKGFHEANMRFKSIESSLANMESQRRDLRQEMQCA